MRLSQASLRSAIPRAHSNAVCGSPVRANVVKVGSTPCLSSSRRLRGSSASSAKHCAAVNWMKLSRSFAIDFSRGTAPSLSKRILEPSSVDSLVSRDAPPRRTVRSANLHSCSVVLTECPIVKMCSKLSRPLASLPIVLTTSWKSTSASPFASSSFSIAWAIRNRVSKASYLTSIRFERDDQAPSIWRVRRAFCITS